MTSVGSLVTLVPLTLFFLQKVISSSTKNSPSARVMRNLTQAAREVPLYFRVHVIVPLPSFTSDPLSSCTYPDFSSPCILISYHPFVLLSILPSVVPPLNLHSSGIGHPSVDQGCGWGWTWAQLHSDLPHAQVQPTPCPAPSLPCICVFISQPSLLSPSVANSHFQSQSVLAPVQYQLMSSLLCALRWTALTSAVNSALLASGATPASAVTSTIAASKSWAYRHRNHGFTTMDTRKARVGEGCTVKIREVEDTGRSTNFSSHALPAFSVPGSMLSVFKYLISFNSYLWCI